jgi:hypothetical protein
MTMTIDGAQGYTGAVGSLTAKEQFDKAGKRLAA